MKKLNMQIKIFVDTSGSMNEMGKIHLQRNLCRYVMHLPFIDTEKYLDLDVHLYQWAQNVSEVDLQSDGDIPVFNAEGFSNLCTLVDFLSQNSARILILSDGNFSNLDISSFQNQLSSYPDLIIRTVAVGADADLWKLKKISTNNRVYLSENIASALDSTIFGSDELVTAPPSTAQILQSTMADLEESEENWDV